MEQQTKDEIEQNSTTGVLMAEGYRCIRFLPQYRWAAVKSFLYTDAIIVGFIETVSVGYEDRWCYEKGKAEAALEVWSGEGEPESWHRHPDSGRRRPDGDPEKEYVAW